MISPGFGPNDRHGAAAGLGDTGEVTGALRVRVLLIAVLIGAGSLAVPATARAAVPGDGNVLETGHCLTASAAHPAATLQSLSRRFELVLTRTDLYIHDEVLLTETSAAGYATWRQAANHRRGSWARLCMRADGNLVLSGEDGVAWSSHTAGTGTHNYAMMRNNGSLVVRTRHDERVWSSFTTAVLLKAGDRIHSGRSLRNYTGADSPTRLEMRRDGNLVLARGWTTEWQTKTHVPGSYVEVTAMGRLVVRSPAGRAVWRSGAVGAIPLLTVSTHGRITLESFASGSCWARPAGGCP
jgi:hypothetical protein